MMVLSSNSVLDMTWDATQNAWIILSNKCSASYMEHDAVEVVVGDV